MKKVNGNKSKEVVIKVPKNIASLLKSNNGSNKKKYEIEENFLMKEESKSSCSPSQQNHSEKKMIVNDHHSAKKNCNEITYRATMKVGVYWTPFWVFFHPAIPF